MTATTLPIVSQKRRVAFYALVGIFSLLLIVVFGFLSPVPYLLWVIVGWFNPEPLNIHQLHNMMGGSLNWVFLAGITLQLHRPERKVAGLQMVILMIFSSMMGSIIDGTFGLFFFRS